MASLRQGKRIKTWFTLMENKAEKAKKVFVNATASLLEVTKERFHSKKMVLSQYISMMQILKQAHDF